MLLFGLTIDQYVIKVDNQNLLMKGCRTWFITLMKVLGALDKPKGMTNNSNKPSYVLNVVFHSSHGLTQI